jgi:DNA polymerase I
MLVNVNNFKEVLESITEDLVIDIETNGLDLWGENELCGIGICTSNLRTYYFPFRHVNPGNHPLLDFIVKDEELNLPLELMNDLFNKIKEKVKVLIGHNLKFDLSGLIKEGFQISDEIILEDTVVLARLKYTDPFDKLNLEILSKNLLNLSEVEEWKKRFKEYMIKNKLKTYNQGDPLIVGEYCERDCLNTWKIRKILLDHVKNTEQEKVWDQEKKLCKILHEMEKEGMHFDMEYLEYAIPLLESKILETSQAIYQIAGKEFDILSHKQLSKVMGILEIKNPVESSWATATLLQIDHPICGYIIDYRSLTKTLGTYFEPLKKCKDHRQHPNFRSGGTVTGRMSCSNPNLQNISNKVISLEEEIIDEKMMDAIKSMVGGSGSNNEGGSKIVHSFSTFKTLASTYNEDTSLSIKRLYTPPIGFSQWAIDFSQMEMRVFADYVKDEKLIEALEDSNFDFHSHVAKEVWKVDESVNAWKFYRTLAKAINFGMIYGIGSKKMALQIQKTQEEAKEYQRDYFNKFPKAKIFMNKVSRAIESRGWVKNRFGRKYVIPRDFAYKGVNYLVQGTSADIVKNRMIEVSKYLQNTQSRMVCQVHDELVFYIKKEEEKEVILKLKEIMEERCIETYLPVDVSKSFPHWGIEKEMCLECWKSKKECDHGKLLRG